MDARFAVAAGIAVLIAAMTGAYLWLDGRGDAMAPPGGESIDTVPGDGADRNPASDENARTEAGTVAAASHVPAIANTREPNRTRAQVSGERAILWAQADAEEISDKLKEERRLRAASGMIDRSLIPGNPDYDGSLAYATPAEMLERFNTEVRDQEWARAVERQAEQYLDSHPFRETYGPFALECKATLCRFAAVADGAVMIASGRAADWQNIMFELMHDPRFAPLFAEHRVSVMLNAEHPGQVGFVSWLRRSQPPDS